MRGLRIVQKNGRISETMKYKHIIWGLLITSIFTACIKDTFVEEGIKTIRAVETEIVDGLGTKASLVSDNAIFWDLNDAIGVFSDTQGITVFQNVEKDGEPTNRFKGDAVSGKEFYAIYPRFGYDSSAPKMLKYSAIQPAAGKSPRLEIPMVAKLGDDGVFRFKQTMGILHFSFKGAKTVTQVELSCNNYDERIYGSGVVDLNDETPVFSLLDGGVFNMSYYCPEPYSIEEGEEWSVYFPVPAMTFSEGFSVRIRLVDNGSYVDVKKTLNRAVSIRRAEIKSFTVTDIDDLIQEREAALIAQREALIKFYNETGGDNWTNNTNWCSDKPVSEWYGIHCDGEPQYVSAINLWNNNLTGKVSPAIVSIPSLCDISLSGNSITAVDFSEANTVNGLLLNLNYNPLTSIDVSGCPKLSTLLLNGTKIESVDVSSSPMLEWLDCSGTKISTIDVRNNPKLRFLGIDGCSISELDITNNPNLFELEGTGCKLKELDLSKSQALETLWVSGNDLSVIDVSSCPKLWQLGLGANTNLTTLVLGESPNLSNIDITMTQVESLDVSKYPKLEQLVISFTNITEIDLNHNPELRVLGFFSTKVKSLDISMLSKLEQLSIGGDPNEVYPDDFHPSIDVSNNPKLKRLACWATKETELDLSNNLLLESVSLKSNDNLKKIYVNPSQSFSCEKDEQAVFVFKGEGEPPYSSTDYSLNRTYTVLQEATEGRGIDLVIMGDAFSDRMHQDGSYDQYMKYAMEEFFEEEPYKSFRNLFNVYCVRVVSKNEVYSAFTETTLVESIDIYGYPSVTRSDTCIDYAKCAISEERIGDAVVLVLANKKNDVPLGRALMTTSSNFGLAIVTLEKDPEHQVRDVGDCIRHECGHAFAKLADEYDQNLRNETRTIPEEEKEYLKQVLEPAGFYRNIDVTDSREAIKWSRFLSDERYTNVGVFEGGWNYNYGVYRPSYNSIMNKNEKGESFNAPSREAIYCRIHELAYGDAWKYDFEKFIEYDAINRNEAKGQSKIHTYYDDYNGGLNPTLPPVVIQGSWRDLL